MYSLFIPENKGKNKTDVRGFWRNDKGITFYDYLRVVSVPAIDSETLEALRIKYNQEAIAYKVDDVLIIFSGIDKIDRLNKRIYTEVLAHDLKRFINSALNFYGGCTVYRFNGKYFIEIFY